MGHTIMDLTDNVTDLLNRINSLNASVRSLQAVVNPMSNTVTRLDETSEDKFQSLNDRLKKIEDSPHLELIEQVDAIHNEVSAIGRCREEVVVMYAHTHMQKKCKCKFYCCR